MGRSELVSRSETIIVEMNKLCLVLLGALAIAAIASAWDHEEDASLSEDLTNSRLVGSPEAKRRRKGRKNNGKGKTPRGGSPRNEEENPRRELSRRGEEENLRRGPSRRGEDENPRREPSRRIGGPNLVLT